MRTYVIQTFYIPSGSMEPTLNVGDRILVFKLAYDFTSPATGDVVVFKAPPLRALRRSRRDRPREADRRAARPDDLVRGQHHLHREPRARPGNPLDQDWPHYRLLFTPITRQLIKPNHYFMMGDNHPASCDSRDWGTLPRSDIIGKVVLKIWPLSQFGTI